MRRMTDGHSTEYGGISVIVAILMVTLLGFVAIAVDVGVIYSERAQLQNGADASAIAMAQKCAKNAGSADCSTTSPIAGALADRNALDGVSKVHTIDLDQISRKVSVAVTAKETGGEADSVSLFFADILGVPTKKVGARASAVWGSPIAGTTPFPLAFSVCQVKYRVDGALQRLQAHGKNANSDCNYGPSGAAVEGGFGWLTPDAGQCGAYIDREISESGSDPGNNAPNGCDGTLQKWANELKAGRKVTVILPVFDNVTATGSGAVYKIATFAAFDVTGWKFSSDGKGLPSEFRNTVSAATGVTSATACVDPCRGMIGRFVKYTSLSDGYTLGPVDEYGATVARPVL